MNNIEIDDPDKRQIRGQEVQETAVIVTKKSMKKRQRTVMSFHNVTYTVDIKKAPCRKADRKRILNGVSGIMKPGLNAIMGQTGGGKSSLLDVLARRKNPDWLSGTVLLDGKPLPKNFQCQSGYVVQDDLLVGTMTVREALWFCANLRLPTSVPRFEKSERIENILFDLGLVECADTKIGTEVIRGLSGGEKKRTSIALELILEPNILFLDEPTTGLDAATANSVVEMLRKLGDQGHTIVFSIHQPRYSIFKYFDTLTLLSSGNIVYHGHSSDVMGFFESAGYVCEAHDNPADFFLDVMDEVYEKKKDENVVEIPAEGEKIRRSSSRKNRRTVAEELKNAYEVSETWKNIELELEQLAGKEPFEMAISAGPKYATSFLHQLKTLLGRTWKNMVRNPQGLIGNLLFNGIIGIVFGLIFYQVDDSADKGIQNRLGVLFFICTNLMFGALQVVELFKFEEAIFRHEHISGYYRVISYFFAKLLADLIPLRTLSPFMLCTITYWMVGFNRDVTSFLIFLCTALLVAYATVAVGLFYSATFSNDVSRLMLVLTFILTIIFTGLLVNVDSIMPWLSWLKYFSVCRYGLVALSINELKGHKFHSCSNITAAPAPSGLFQSGVDLRRTSPDNDTICITVLGDKFLYDTLAVGNGVDAITSWDLWQNIVALSCMAVGIFTLAYMQLARVKTYS